jgi:hypothetical protein
VELFQETALDSLVLSARTVYVDTPCCQDDLCLFENPCTELADSGGSMHLWNVGLLIRDYSAPCPRTLSSSIGYEVSVRKITWELFRPTQRCVCVCVCVCTWVFVRLVSELWPARSPDLNSLNFYSWCHLKVLCMVLQLKADPGGRAVYGVGLRPIGCWNCGFKSRSGHGCLSLVFIKSRWKTDAS